MKKIVFCTVFLCFIMPSLIFGNTHESYHGMTLTIITNIRYYSDITYNVVAGIPHEKFCNAPESGSFAYREKEDINCSTPPTPDSYLMRIQILSSTYPYGKVFCDFSYNFLTHHVNWITHHPYQGKKPYPPLQCKISNFPNHVFLFVYDKKL